MANKGSFKKGEKRPKQGKRGEGKVTKELKAMILEALDNAGGISYLEKQAEKNPTAFLTLVGKVLPLQLTGENGGAILIKNVGVDIDKV